MKVHRKNAKNLFVHKFTCPRKLRHCSSCFPWDEQALVYIQFQNLQSRTQKAGSLKMNTSLEYSTREVQEGGRRCKKSTLNDLVHLTPLRIPLMNPPRVSKYKAGTKYWSPGSPHTVLWSSIFVGEVRTQSTFMHREAHIIYHTVSSSFLISFVMGEPARAGWLSSSMHLSSPSRVSKFLYSPAPPTPHSMGPETSLVGFLCTKPPMHLWFIQPCA
jgi:hypothetical protein